MPASRDTPAMKQYRSFKDRHPDCLLLFRMGDFYELFDDDAVTASRALGLTLTQRTEGIPMAGVPYHALEGYLRRLIAQGFRVAVCEQIQDPKEAKGIVERAVTRVITPGTLVDESLLDESATCALAAVCFLDAGEEPEGRVAGACAELSTGAFSVFECSAGALGDELARRGVSEVLFAEPAPGAGAGRVPARVERVLKALGISGTGRPSWHFRQDEAHRTLTDHFQVASLEAFGLGDEDPLAAPAGAIVRYLRETQSLDGAPTATTGMGASAGSGARGPAPARSLAHLRPPRRDDPRGVLIVDALSLRALEVEQTVRPGGASRPAGPGRARGADGSLLSVFLGGGAGGGVGCATSMGRRLLRQWLVRPLGERGAIEARQSAVAALVETPALAAAVGAALEGVQDAARLSARVGLGRASPRDLVALGRSVGQSGALARAIDGSPALAGLARALADAERGLAPLALEIARVCVEEPPAQLREGGLVRDGIDAALDEARLLQRQSGDWLVQYQATLIEAHQLPSLRVGFNKIFGYFIELPAAQARRAPAEFARRQTLKNAERFITPELREYERKVLSAGDRALEREQAIFARLCAEAVGLAALVACFADAVAELDALLCLARVAAKRGWRRPVMRSEAVLDIRQGRHPVLDESLEGRFVPNDCSLGRKGGAGSGPSLALITGPNMGGKSTYIRQVALLVLLAHAGSFVPAEHAEIGLVDRIFTRVGADDALHAGQSTFMVEMVETAGILHHATERSLVILDEIGRGTSTLDGLALAWAIAERLAQAGPRTLFATHYHELTALEERLGGSVANLHVEVREWPAGDAQAQIVFLHRISPGRASRSYGLHVARLAGLPASVVGRAGEVLEALSVSHEPGGSERRATDARRVPAPAGALGQARGPAPAPGDGQLALFTEYLPHPALAELARMDLDRLSPMGAFDALRRLQLRARQAEPEQDGAER